MTSARTVRATRVLYVTALVCTALVLGLTLAHVLQSPGSRGLSGAEWLDVQHTFYGGFAVVGGVAEMIGLVTGIALTVLVWRHRARAAVSPLIAAAAMFGTLLSYWFGNRPVNALIVGWTPDTLPGDWSAYRATWENAHAISAGLAAVAFVALLVLMWPPLAAVTGAARPGPAPATGTALATGPAPATGSARPGSAPAIPGPSER